MKKKKLWGEVLSLVTTYAIFFGLAAFVVTCSFLLFFSYMEVPRDQVSLAAKLTFLNILLLTGFFVVFDTVRRRLTVERQVEQIKNALRQITAGDFKVRLDVAGSQSNFTEIMESINQMTEELSGVETLRTDFIANVSHEMKTPLAVMQNYGTLLQTPGLSEEKRLEYAKVITSSSRKLADLMTNILKLNRLENQQIFPQTKEYDLGEQLCECLLQYESVWEKEEIEIDTEIEENVIVKADDELLALVWNNLLSNAFKFTDRGGKVTVSLRTEGEYAVVSVTDTGCGISPKVGAKIFDKFYQGDTSHSTQGNGLGLALVKRIIDILNGEISVSSSLGKGSTFTVNLRKN